MSPGCRTNAGICALLSFAAVFCHQRQFTFDTPVSRLDALRAVAQNGNVVIDRWHTNTLDKALVGGHYYSDKAPGVVAVGLVPFVVTLALCIEPDSPGAWLATSWVTAGFTNGLPSVVGLAVLFAWLRRHVPARIALLSILAIGVGGMPLPYATALWSHSLVVGLVCVAVWALDMFGSQPVARWRFVGAGAALGLALASEYTAGLVILGLGGYAAFRQRRGLWILAAAATPPLLLVPAYNSAVTGNPLVLPYTHQASFPQMMEGVYAIRWPNLEIAGRLLFSPERGLFFWSPFLLLAVAGHWRLAQTQPRWLWLTYALPLANIVVVSGRVWDWQAGFCFGPRYLAPILPLLALPCALGLLRLPRLGVILVAVSIGLASTATLTNAVFPKYVGNPLLEVTLPLLCKADFNPNLGTLLGLSPWASVALFYVILIVGITWLWHQARRLDCGAKEEPHAA
jgi:hypothetical protein